MYMKNFIKSLSLLILIFSFIFSSVFAANDNKENLLIELWELKTSFEELSDNKEEYLTDNVYIISNSYNNIFSDLWYDESTISNLISMWKLDSDFKWDLVVDYTALKNDIVSKVNAELLLINSFIDDISLNYWDVSEVQNTTFQTKVDQFESNLEDYESLFWDRIDTLINKYNDSLNDTISNISDIVSSNSTDLSSLSIFTNSFDDFTENINEFNENYEIFKDQFLAYSWDITDFSESKQLEYVELLETNLTALIDKNLELNPSLSIYSTEIKRFADILIENFSYNLMKDLSLEYGVLYSESDVNSLLSKYEVIKNKYFDAEWNVKANDVLSSETILENISSYESKISEINSEVLLLIWNSDNSIETIKIKLENQIIRFYNTNYWDFKDDLSTKIKEKISFISLENKNAIAIAESIDIRYEALAAKIKSQYNIETLKSDIDSFKSKINKFTAITNDSLTLKIDNLNYTLDVFLLNRIIKHPDYNNYSSLISKYKTALSEIFTKFENKYDDETSDKLNIVLERVNSALETNLSVKNKFMLYNVKLNIIEFLHNLD